MRTLDRRAALAVAAITLLALVLRVWELGTRAYWADEIASVLVLREDFGGMLDLISEQEGSPPLYYVLGWGWAQLFGTGEAGTRSLLVVFGTALVPVVALIGVRLGGARAGLAAALLAAVSPLLVFYARETRTYALYALLAALTMLLFLRALDAPRPGRLAAWSVVSALALTSHYFAGFLVAAEAIWLLVALREWRRRVAVACVLPALTAVALLPLAAAQSGHAAAFLENEALTRRLAQLPTSFAAGPQAPRVFVAAGSLVLLAAAVLWLVAVVRADGAARRRLVLPAVLAAAVVVPPLVIELAGPSWFNVRNVLGAWVPVAVAVALGCLAARRLGVAVLAALVVCSVGVVVATAGEPKFAESDWRGAARALGSPATDRAIVIADRGLFPLVWYLHGERIWPGGAPPVAEIAMIEGTRRVGSFGADFEPVRAPSRPPPRGFEEVERREDPTYTLVRYRAARPRPVPEEELVALRLQQGAKSRFVLEPGRK